MSEHKLILEFYKPTYNLDFDYNGDGGLDLHFTNIKGEFFMTMENSYDGIYFEDEDCEFSKGEMFATVDLGDLVERIINGEFRQTNGKAVSDWGKRFIGDGEDIIEFDGRNYADGSLFWDDFFKEMSKDEIKDFLKFCESYVYLPNIEVDTVSNKWDFENGKVELKSNDKWGIGISDDYNIIEVESFTCDSADAFVAYDVASSESDEDDFYESKKYVKKSLKEGKTVTLKKDGEFIDRIWNTIAQARDYAREVLNGADIYVNGDFWETVNGNRKSMKESKKSARRSLKESMKFVGDVKYNDIYGCDIINVLEVSVYDKALYEKLREEDLVLYQKGSYEQIDWKSFQDEIGYLKDDMGTSGFSMMLELDTNGALVIKIKYDEDNETVMEYCLKPRIVTF